MRLALRFLRALHLRIFERSIIGSARFSDTKQYSTGERPGEGNFNLIHGDWSDEGRGGYISGADRHEDGHEEVNLRLFLRIREALLELILYVEYRNLFDARYVLPDRHKLSGFVDAINKSSPQLIKFLLFAVGFGRHFHKGSFQF
jgi:hypothetical protein